MRIVMVYVVYKCVDKYKLFNNINLGDIIMRTRTNVMVIIFRKNKIVKAVNQAHETIKEFEIEE